jgi:hypothetical protein
MQVDPNDPELIRELAKKHWDLINTALATDGDFTIASQPQIDFLDKYIPSLPPDLAKKVFEIYSEESAKHAAQMERIGDNKLEQAKRQAALIKRQSTKVLVISVVILLFAVFKFASKIFAA